jgi:nucleoside 2-deoxyribosyltransferase
MKTIYIAYSVTNKDPDVEETMSAIISWLSDHHSVMRPQKSSSAGLLAKNAIECLNRSDLIIADVTVYSHGVGFELGYAYALKKDIIVVANLSAKNNISQFIQGLFPEIVYYQNLNELKGEIRENIVQLGIDI